MPQDPLPRQDPLTIVICVDHAATNGGQAKVAADSAIGLKRHGHRPILFAAAGPVAPELRAAGVEVVCLDQKELLGSSTRIAGAVQGTWNFRAVAALSALLADLPRERTIVHVHGWAKALSPAIARPIKASGLPAIYTIHEYFLFCPNGGFYNYQRSHICGLKPLSAACWATHCDPHSYGRKLWRNARLTMARSLLKFPEVFSDFITISDFQRGIVAPFLPANARVHGLSNPVSIENLGPKPDPAAGDILFIGRLAPEKGPFLFAEAARKIGLVPTFVGDGPSMADLAARFPEARLLGWQTGNRLRDLTRSARAVVFPSLWYEGQPLAVLEAKAMGTPVIVSNACAGREEVEDGVTGLWFEGGNAEDLARALTMMRDDARVAAMSAAAHRAFWAEPRTLDRHIEGLVSIYDGMIGPREAGLAESPFIAAESPSASHGRAA